VNAQASLPGIHPGPAMLDETRGHQALTVVAFDVWAIEAKVQRGALAENVTAWLEAGRPDHPMVGPVLDQLARHLARLGTTPAWMPPPLANLITERTTTP